MLTNLADGGIQMLSKKLRFLSAADIVPNLVKIREALVVGEAPPLSFFEITR